MVRFILFSSTILLLFFFGQTQEVSGNPITISQAVTVGNIIYKGIKYIKEYFNGAPSPDDELDRSAIIAIQKLNEISKRIYTLENDLLGVMTRVELLDISQKSKSIYDTMYLVRQDYERFMKKIQSRKPLNNTQIENFLNSLTGFKKDDFPNLIARMHADFTNSTDATTETFIDTLMSKKSAELLCLRNQPPQQIITGIYNAIIVTDLQAFTMQLLAQELQKNNSTEPEYIDETSELADFKQRIKNTYKATVKRLPYASRNLWKCDPKNYDNSTYAKLAEVFQAFITNERDTQLDTCSFSGCYELNTQKKGRLSYQSISHYSQLQPEKLRCNGYITDCKPTAARIDYCIAPKDSDRRYLGMRTSINYGYYDEHCQSRDKAEEVPKVFNNCQFCLCTCASKVKDMDRYFSLKAVTSNWKRGMVVTGVRLTKLNHVFYIEIQEGRLIENATIESDSTYWKNEPDNYRVSFERIYHEHSKSVNQYGDFPTNEEVYSVNWEQKTVYLDDIEIHVPETDVVLTGLQFKQEDDALMLQIRMSPFIFETGEILEEGQWYFNDRVQHERTRVSLDKAEDPRQEKFKNTIDSKNGEYLKFAVTNLEADMGQYTIPFLDIQPVVTNPSTPLAGAGLYHKGIPDSSASGGFLGLKLIEYNFAKHLHE